MIVRTGAVVIMALGLPVALVACGSDNASTDAETGRGAAVYAESCASCHGGELGGTDTGPPLLSIVYEPNHHPDDSFRRAIAVGAPQHHWNFGDMEPIEGLSESDVDVVIAFVRAEQQRLGFER